MCLLNVLMGRSEGFDAFRFFFELLCRVFVLTANVLIPPKLSDYSGALAAFRFFLVPVVSCKHNEDNCKPTSALFNC